MKGRGRGLRWCRRCALYKSGRFVIKEKKKREKRERVENFSSSPNSGPSLSTNLNLSSPHQWHPKSNSSRREERNQPMNACIRPRWSSFSGAPRPSFFRTKMALALFSLSVIALLCLAFLGFLISISVCAILVFSLLTFSILGMVNEEMRGSEGDMACVRFWLWVVWEMRICARLCPIRFLGLVELSFPTSLEIRRRGEDRCTRFLFWLLFRLFSHLPNGQGKFYFISRVSESFTFSSVSSIRAYSLWIISRMRGNARNYNFDF